MSFQAVYEPTGKAREYCELALNIYDGCPNGCYYCYAPKVRHMQKEEFHNHCQPYKNICERAKYDAESGLLTGKTVQLCFTCDPYPSGVDTTPTREIIQNFKDCGVHVQILTKNPSCAARDFDLLDGKDFFGVTLTAFSKTVSFCAEPKADMPIERLSALKSAKQLGISTWVSFEPVIKAGDTLALLDAVIEDKSANFIKIGKMNYFNPQSPVNWADFGRRAEAKCKAAGQPYYIKESLRAEMEKA
jgi:DNA repair photolyase